MSIDGLSGGTICFSHVISTNQTTLPQTFAHPLGTINVFSDSKLAIGPVVLQVHVLDSEGHLPVDENRSTRNSLMLMKTTNTAYNQNPAALAYFLPGRGAAVFAKARKLRVGANRRDILALEKAP